MLDKQAMGQPRPRIIIAASVLLAAWLVPQVAVRAQQVPQAAPESIIRAREKWFYGQRAYPLKRIPPGARLHAVEQLHQMLQSQGRRTAERTKRVYSISSTAATSTSTLSSTQWTLIGPQPTDNSRLGLPYSPVSGRVTALAVDPTNADVVYLGAAEGGVWKTTDGGTTWTPLTDNQPSLAVGSIAIDPSNHNTIYVGTGEENFNGDAYFGAGILKSTDGGSTWTQISGPFVGPFGSDASLGGAYIGSIAVSPTNSQVILVAANFSGNSASGLYLSINGGQNWTLVESGVAATQVLFQPGSGSVAYTAIFGAGVYKSTDGGLTWTADNGTGTNVLPSGASSTGRFALAIDPKNTSTLYAGVGGPFGTSGSLGTFVGLFKTTDGGANWTQLSLGGLAPYCSPGSPAPGQCDYDNVVAVDPSSSSVFLGGSTDLQPPNTAGSAPIYRSEDGGSTWNDVDTGTNGGPLHPDVHAIAFAADGSVMYVGTDGGVWRTPNITSSPVTWTDRNAPLALSQFYPELSTLSYAAQYAIGGTQDNGTQLYQGSPRWQTIEPGDGGWTAADPASSPNTGTLYWAQALVLGITKIAYPSSPPSQAVTGITSSDRLAVLPLVMDPSNPNTLYFGTYRVYQTIDGAANWTVEQVLVRVQQKARLVIGVQRTQPHEASPPEASSRLPIVGLQVIQQRNLLLQFIERFAVHGLMASSRRIRHAAGKSQARMVGVWRKLKPNTFQIPD